ncbi:MAG: hypothetical protein V4581_16700 [Bacteroidota bacterium]
MSELLARVKSLPNICGIQFAFDGSLIPSTIPGYQQFYNALESDTDFEEAYFGRGSVSFIEESAESAAGISYSQKLSIQFRVSDGYRADRLVLLHNAKYIKIRLSNLKDMVIGRNDFEQNARPRIKVQTDERLGQATFETVSIFPTGYVPNPQAAGLPEFIPIDLTGIE